MSFPFGGHPTLKEFIEFAEGVGCSAKVFARGVKGKVFQVLEITNQAGGRVVVANPDLAEHLSPSTVTYLQRRLAIRTPFAVRPEQTLAETSSQPDH